MSTGRVRRLSTREINSALDSLVGLQTLPHYQPRNPELSIEMLTERARKMEEARQVEARIQKELAIARDNSIAAEHEFNEGIMASKDEVRTQYGRDAQALQLVGLKRKSERRRPVRRAKKAA
jgi:hypothetical protein